MANDNAESTTISFHEASLKRVVKKDDTVMLDLEEVPTDGYAADEKSIAIRVLITNVTSITRNAEPVDGIEQESPDGEVLTLRQKKVSVVLVVLWRNFNPASSDTVTYEFCGAELHF